MAVLYVVSEQEAAGKTTICAGLGKYFLDSGKKVAYLKPLGDGAETAFMKNLLGMPEAEEALCPAGDVKAIKEAVERLLQGRDVVLVEGRLDQDASEIARALNARVIIVEGYSASGSMDSYKGFGQGLLGVILNKVPQSQLSRITADAPARFGAVGINVLGVLPEDRALFAVTVGELAAGIQGKLLNNANKAETLVENYMLGALIVDSGLDYYGRKERKAAVLKNNRPDMQLAALETSTTCLVLSDSHEAPIYNVLHKAEAKGIPVIASEKMTADIITDIEDTLSQGRFSQARKLPRLAEMMKQHLNLKALS